MDKHLSKKSPVATFIVTRPGEHGGIQTVATVTARVTHEDLTEEKPFLEALTHAITQWIKYTSAGREAWKNSSEDFNIGDLSMHLDEGLMDYMKEEGIKTLNINVMDVQERFCRDWTFDTVLVNGMDLEE